MLKALLRANKCNKDAVKYIHGDGDEIVWNGIGNLGDSLWLISRGTNVRRWITKKKKKKKKKLEGQLLCSFSRSCSNCLLIVLGKVTNDSYILFKIHSRITNLIITSNVRATCNYIRV
jgi:hypothetical protein